MADDFHQQMTRLILDLGEAHEPSLPFDSKEIAKFLVEEGWRHPDPRGRSLWSKPPDSNPVTVLTHFYDVYHHGDRARIQQRVQSAILAYTTPETSGSCGPLTFHEDNEDMHIWYRGTPSDSREYYAVKLDDDGVVVSVIPVRQKAVTRTVYEERT